MSIEYKLIILIQILTKKYENEQNNKFNTIYIIIHKY